MSQYVIVGDAENHEPFSVVKVHSEDDRELIMDACKDAIDQGWCWVSGRISDCNMTQFQKDWKESEKDE